MVKNFFNKNNFQKENSLGFLTSLLQQSHKILKSVGNKKAELTTQQLVGIIILIISFGVVLFFIFSLNLGELSNKEICHNSVVLAGKSLTGASLDCNTEYVCISGGGECEGFNYGRKVEVDASDKNEIMKVIADEMVDCWWMFGEGKVEYVKGYRDFHCGICSIIEFDSEIKEKYSSNGIFHYLRFYDFLSESNLDDSQIYLNYLYDLNSKINTKLKFKAEKLFEKLSFSENIFPNQRYAIVTGLNNDAEKLGFKDDYIHPYFVKLDEITSQTSCQVFDVTKA